MKTTSFLLAMLAAILSSQISLADSTSTQPNIILVMIDDMGWGDVGCYGNDFIDTPNIDQMAADGLRFTNFYASGAVCSPTRCAIQAGQNQARIGITAHIPGHWRPFERVQTPVIPRALPLDIVTIAETLKTVNRKTGYIGKWHLGYTPQHQPDHQGYDESYVINGPHLPGRYRVAGRKDIKPKDGQYRTEFEADLATDFIDRHKDEPFFLMVSPFAVHIPLGAMSKKVQKYRAKAKSEGRKLPNPIYAAMVEHCDDLMGTIFDAVEKAGITDNTMIVFTSDNGGLVKRYDYREQADDIVSDLAPLRGEKGTLYEGGIRVPLIVKYPAMVDANQTTDQVAISHDFYRTFANLAGAELPANQTIDGIDLGPVLKNPSQPVQRGPVYWHYPHFHHDRPATAMRDGDWKLIEFIDGSDDVQLFHVSQDIGETKDLSSQQPQRLVKMQKQMHRWRDSIDASVTVANPGYDADRASHWYSLRSGKRIDSDGRKRFPATELEAAMQ